MRAEARDQGRRWLRQAEIDLGWVRRLLEEGAYYLACFHSQQAAEKALKGLLYAQGEESVLGHSVRRLTERAGTYEPAFSDSVGKWGILDTFYIPTRYPNGLPDGIPADVYNRSAAEQAVELAAEVVRAVAEWFAKD